MNVFDHAALHEQPHCVVIKYTQSHATGSEISQRIFGRVKAALYKVSLPKPVLTGLNGMLHQVIAK